jgi:hypothetical protein
MLFVTPDLTAIFLAGCVRRVSARRVRKQIPANDDRE